MALNAALQVLESICITPLIKHQSLKLPCCCRLNQSYIFQSRANLHVRRTLGTFKQVGRSAPLLEDWVNPVAVGFTNQRIFTVPDSSRSKTTDLPASCKEQLIPLQPPQFSPVCYGIAIHTSVLNMILQTPVSCWGCLGVSLLKQERCCSLQVGGKESWIMWLKGPSIQPGVHLSPQSPARGTNVSGKDPNRDVHKNVHWCT